MATSEQSRGNELRRVPEPPFHGRRLATLPDVAIFQQADSSSPFLRLMVRVGISGLLLSRGPSAIRWAIRPLIVYAIKRVLWAWALTHVSDKISERVTPSLTHGNTFPSISIPTGMIRISTSADHQRPRVIFTSTAYSSVCAMLREARPSAFGQQATATPSSGIDIESVASNLGKCSAVATTFPYGVLALESKKAQNRKATVTLSSFIEAGLSSHMGQLYVG